MGKRGFGNMPPEQQARIASAGGKRAHELGRAHKFDAAEGREAGRRGGKLVSRDREHMAEIGRKGGRARQARARAAAQGAVGDPVDAKKEEG